MFIAFITVSFRSAHAHIETLLKPEQNISRRTYSFFFSYFSVFLSFIHSEKKKNNKNNNKQTAEQKKGFFFVFKYLYEKNGFVVLLLRGCLLLLHNKDRISCNDYVINLCIDMT